MEIIEVNGQPVTVPPEVVSEGPDAMHRWFTEQDAPHAQALMAKEGVKAREVTATGAGGVILTSDVQRALHAREAAKAKPESPADAPPATPDAPKEG